MMTTLGDDVRVGIYVRRSTDDEHQPYSIEAQDRAYRPTSTHSRAGAWSHGSPTMPPAPPPNDLGSNARSRPPVPV